MSAIAKRRRLNDGSAIATTESDTLVISDTKQSSTARKTRTRQVKRIAKVAQAEDTELVEDENSFEPLIKAQAVKFSGLREVTEVGSSSIVVRLSKGQVGLGKSRLGIY